MNSKIKRIYIAGCGGMLGEAFYNVFSKDYKIKCSDKIVNESWIENLDFTNFDKYESEVVNFNSDLYVFVVVIYPHITLQAGRRLHSATCNVK